MAFSTRFTVGFMATICVVCSALVSVAAVTLRDRHQVNALRDRQRNVLVAAGLVERGEKVSEETVAELFEARVKTLVVDLEEGTIDTSIDPTTYDPRRAAQDPEQRRRLAENSAGLVATAPYELVYELTDEDGELDAIVLPVAGRGLWSTLYGYLALESDAQTVSGLTYYEHGETPGLGGEVDNPRWKALWPGRKIYDDSGEVGIKVVKGQAGPVEKAPYEVDGLSGATLTSRGVTHMIRFWLGPDGFKPYLENFRKNEGSAQ